MSLIEAIVLGIVQGVTEFLPISSSLHLIIVPWLLGWDEPGLAFDAALHLGTLAAVLVYFWRDLLAMARALPLALRCPVQLLRGADPGDDHRAAEARLALLIGIGVLPAGLAGLLGQGLIEGFFHDEVHRRAALIVSAILLMAVGLLLWVADRAASHRRNLTGLTWRDALIVGVAQAAALLPGVSRSGATITAALFRDLRRPDAARFSFLLGIPLVFAAGMKAVLDAVEAGMTRDEVWAFVAGGLTAALVGFVAIWGLLRYLQRASMTVFVVYRLLLGAVLLALVAAGFR